MGSLAQLCWLAVVVGASVARPTAEISQRDARGQTVMDSSNPLERPRSIPMELNEAYKGGVVPVALLYEQEHGESGAVSLSQEGEVKRPLRYTVENEEREDTKSDEEGKMDEEGMKNNDNSKDGNFQQDTRGGNKNSKLLDVEARERDDNAKYGLGIQSRNKVSAGEENEELEKPFVYNIQPLSFYSSELKDEENILNYINRIKEMKENQIKFAAAKKQEKGTAANENGVSEENKYDSEEEDRPVRRRIQHYSTVIKPIFMEPQAYGGGSAIKPIYMEPHIYGGGSAIKPTFMESQAYGGGSAGLYPAYPTSSIGPYPQLYQQSVVPNFYQSPPSSSIVYLPNPFQSQHSTQPNSKIGNNRIFEGFFPVLINNPFELFTEAFTNIIEYGPEIDVCKKSKTGRVIEDEGTTEIDLPAQRLGLGGLGGLGSKPESWPKFAKLKVRRGGVAIAGPGGIATAGSGGTAIVGPGGTAYTTREGTAVVGPGGRVVHVPEFPIYAKNVDGNEPREFVPPPGSRTVAEGPIVYYDNPLDEDDISDPTFPV